MAVTRNTQIYVRIRRYICGG